MTSKYGFESDDERAKQRAQENEARAQKKNEEKVERQELGKGIDQRVREILEEFASANYGSSDKLAVEWREPAQWRLCLIESSTINHVLVSVNLIKDNIVGNLGAHLQIEEWKGWGLSVSFEKPRPSYSAAIKLCDVLNSNLQIPIGISYEGRTSIVHGKA